MLSFKGLLEYYYSITDDVSPKRAEAYAAYVINGPARVGADLSDFGPVPSTAVLLDAGCGAGAGLVAAHDRFATLVGIDIALRWLVICRKRLDELGVTATLLCADVEALPFENAYFTHVLATDLFEHVYDQECSMRSLRAQMKPGGLLWACAVNSLWPGPHPSTGTWAAGYRRYLPFGSRSLYWRSNPLRYVSHVSAASMRDLCKRAGLDVLEVSPRRVGRTQGIGRSKFERLAISSYSTLYRASISRGALVTFGPAFQILARAP